MDRRCRCYSGRYDFSVRFSGYKTLEEDDFKGFMMNESFFTIFCCGDIMGENLQFEKALFALSEIYISIYEFDLVNNKLQAYKSNKYIDALSDPFEGAQEKLNNVMSNISVSEHVSAIMEFVDLSTLPHRLNGKKDISIVFMGKVNGWCRARFIVLDNDETGKLSHVLYTVEGINEEKNRENHLLYLAQTDLLTDINNRGYGERRIRELIDNEKCGMFILFDVDKFKLVNDRFGHQVGDEVLIAISKELSAIASDNDVVMRLGGDEFAAYFPGIIEQEDGEKKIKEFFDRISRIKVKSMNEAVTVSLGACFVKAKESFEHVYSCADKGVYASKNSKGSSFVIG